MLYNSVERRVKVLDEYSVICFSKKAIAAAEEAKAELKGISEDLACARLEIDGARREIERLNRENRALRIGKSAL